MKQLARGTRLLLDKDAVDRRAVLAWLTVAALLLLFVSFVLVVATVAGGSA